jgi:hypothetical protein
MSPPRRKRQHPRAATIVDAAVVDAAAATFGRLIRLLCAAYSTKSEL